VVEHSAREVGTFAAASPYPNSALLEKTLKNEVGNTETQIHRIIGWKRSLRSSSPTTQPTPPFLLKHILKCHFYMFFKHLQGW